jgi:hypothetical protein
MTIRRSALCLSVLAALGTCEAPSLSATLSSARSGIALLALGSGSDKVMKKCHPKVDNGRWEGTAVQTFVGQQDPSDEDCVPPWLYEVDPEQFLELLESGCPICEEEHAKDGRRRGASGSSTSP